MIVNQNTEKNKKYLACIWFIFIAVLNPPLANANNRYEALASSNVKCNSNFIKNGSYILKFSQECDVYNIHLDFKIKTSIINLTLSIQKLTNDTNLTESSSEENFNITVNIYEPTQYNNGNSENILQEEWDENNFKVPIKRSYLSCSSEAYISISGTGNWSDHNITFSFEEIQYSLRLVNSSFASGEIGDDYRPNTVSLYRLLAEPNKRWQGIEITVKDLHISKEMGEYLLIGAGSDIFESKDFPPLYITEVIPNSTFYVDDPNAYVAFVSGSTQKPDEGFKIEWNREVATLPDIREDPLGVLNSSLICFYNYSAAMKEFEKNDEEKFKTFREYFAESVNDYINSHEEYKNINNLDETSVKLFGHPTQMKLHDDSNVLAILIKIMYEGKSIFTENQLQNFIVKFEKNSTNLFFGYKAGKCPRKEKELPYKEKWSFLIYAIVPVFGLFSLMIWAWKQNIFAQKCTAEKKEKPSFCAAPLILSEPNAYETTIPKVCLYDEHCRRETLIQGSSQPEEEKNDQEIAIEMNAVPSTSRDSDTLTRFLTNRKSKHRPSIQSLIDKNEETNELSYTGKAEAKELEHLYDSVNSNKQTDETKL